MGSGKSEESGFVVVFNGQERKRKLTVESGFGVKSGVGLQADREAAVGRRSCRLESWRCYPWKEVKTPLWERKGGKFDVLKGS